MWGIELQCLLHTKQALALYRISQTPMNNNKVATQLMSECLDLIMYFLNL